VHPLWAAIVGQPCNSISICRVHLGQAMSQLCQRTKIDYVIHRSWLSTGTQVGVGLPPSLPAGHRNDLAQCGSESGETTVIEGGQNLVVGLWG